jgi:hypothetical protein
MVLGLIQSGEGQAFVATDLRLRRCKCRPKGVTTLIDSRLIWPSESVTVVWNTDLLGLDLEL